MSKFNGILLQGFSWTSCPTRISCLVSVEPWWNHVQLVGAIDFPALFLFWLVQLSTFSPFLGSKLLKYAKCRSKGCLSSWLWSSDCQMQLVLFLSVVFVQLLRGRLVPNPSIRPQGNTCIKNLNVTKSIHQERSPFKFKISFESTSIRNIP
jgi:hypothetical protein